MNVIPSATSQRQSKAALQWERNLDTFFPFV